MGRFPWPWIAVVLMAIVVATRVSSDQRLLADTDTRVMLVRIEQRSSPLSWFAGDWPLENHFYRPISTLLFELDLRLYGRQAWGFSLTNALLCAGTIIVLFWTLKILFRQNLLPFLATLFFASLHERAILPLGVVQGAAVLFAILSLATLPRAPCLGRTPRQQLLHVVGAFLLGAYAFSYLTISTPIASFVLGWIPGRTASSATLFLLTAIALFALAYDLRFPDRALPVAGSDPRARPRVPLRSPRLRAWALAGSYLALALALGCYEQAIVAPLLISLLALTAAPRLTRACALGILGTWAIAGLYLVARFSFVPTAPSDYQLQQFRLSLTPFLALAEYALPSSTSLYLALRAVEPSWIFLLTPLPYRIAYRAVVELYGLGTVLREPRLRAALVFLALALIAYAPMAFLKPFGHYHYLPHAFLMTYAALLVALLAQRFTLLLSPRPRPAPPRPDPEFRWPPDR